MSTKHERSATLPQAKLEGPRPGTGGVTVDRLVHIFAGSFILLSLALARYHSAYWLWFTVFVGANLLQSGLTNWCLMSTILHKLGVPEGKAVGCSR
jgi:Protein of unknown function (DUF2892)